jgi:hypothetical protein
VGRTKSGIPEWSKRILALRSGFKFSQSELGRRVGASAMAVSRWERGIAEPPGRAYMGLGNLAGDPLCWFFWERAGLSAIDFKRAFAAARLRQENKSSSSAPVVHAGAGHKAKRIRFANVPLLPVHAATPGEQGDKEADLIAQAPERVLPLPLDWCPHPETTVCMRVRGNSMSPLILDGYIIALDTSDTERDSLEGEIVVAGHIDRGLLVSRLIRFDHTDALVSDHREYKSVFLATLSEWKIIGRVLWWAGKAR